MLSTTSSSPSSRQPQQTLSPHSVRHRRGILTRSGIVLLAVAFSVGTQGQVIGDEPMADGASSGQFAAQSAGGTSDRLTIVVCAPDGGAKVPNVRARVYTFETAGPVKAGKKYLLAIETETYCRPLVEIALEPEETSFKLLLVERIDPEELPPGATVVYENPHAPQGKASED